LLLRRSEPLIVDYHNVTPASLVDRWEPGLHEELVLGRKQLVELAGRAFFALADSEYNEEELVASGFRRTTVVPPLFSLDGFDADLDSHLLESLRSVRAERGGSDWLFVGRVAPHKAQHELVKALAAYRLAYDPEARLHLVGNPLGESYPRALRRFIDRLGLDDAVEVSGSVSRGALAAYFHAADVFVCASAHEGFCVPVVEAMHAGLPVVALAAAAVPGTVGDAGLVLENPTPLAFAAASRRIVNDSVCRDSLVRAGYQRAGEFSLDRSRKRLLAAVGEAAAIFGEAAAISDNDAHAEMAT
jgi:glycosyltransferase involved in cell wall biosynthesis